MSIFMSEWHGLRLTDCWSTSCNFRCFIDCVYMTQLSVDVFCWTLRSLLMPLAQVWTICWRCFVTFFSTDKGFNDLRIFKLMKINVWLLFLKSLFEKSKFEFLRETGCWQSFNVLSMVYKSLPYDLILNI